MSDSKSGSKGDLNESNMPLLDDDQTEKGGETPEKIEMTEEGVEKDDSKETEKEKKKKEKKEKKEKKKKEPKEPKVPKEKKPKGPSCVETLSAGLDMTDRDGKLINTDVCLNFDDVFAEPGSTHGIDPVWQIAFVLFSQTKLWLYKIFAAVLAIPAALVWGLVFSLVTVLYVWILAPALRLLDLIFAVVRRVLVGVLRCTVEPVCSAMGACFSRIGVSQKSIV